MFGFSFRELFINVVANIAAANIGTADMIGYLFGVACIVACIVGWHRRRASEKKRGVDSWYFIGLCGLVAVLAVAGVAYGIALRSPAVSAPSTQSGSHPTEPQTGSILIPGRYYSAKNKEAISDILDKTSEALNKQASDILLSAEVAINQSPWDRPGEDLSPLIFRLEGIQTTTAIIRKEILTDLYSNYPDYRVELNDLLFPIEAVGYMQSSAKEFQNAIVVWGVNRESFQGKREDFVGLVNVARASFAMFRTKFLEWVTQRSDKIALTRRALRNE